MKKLLLVAAITLVGCQATPKSDVSHAVDVKCTKHTLATVEKLVPQSPAEAVAFAWIENQQRKKVYRECIRRYI